MNIATIGIQLITPQTASQVRPPDPANENNNDTDHDKEASESRGVANRVKPGSPGQHVNKVV